MVRPAGRRRRAWGPAGPCSRWCGSGQRPGAASASTRRSSGIKASKTKNGPHERIFARDQTSRGGRAGCHPAGQRGVAQRILSCDRRPDRTRPGCRARAARRHLGPSPRPSPLPPPRPVRRPQARADGRGTANRLAPAGRAVRVRGARRRVRRPHGPSQPARRHRRRCRRRRAVGSRSGYGWPIAQRRRFGSRCRCRPDAPVRPGGRWQGRACPGQAGALPPPQGDAPLGPGGPPVATCARGASSSRRPLGRSARRRPEPASQPRAATPRRRCGSHVAGAIHVPARSPSAHCGRCSARRHHHRVRAIGGCGRDNRGAAAARARNRTCHWLRSCVSRGIPAGGIGPCTLGSAPVALGDARIRLQIRLQICGKSRFQFGRTREPERGIRARRRAAPAAALFTTPAAGAAAAEATAAAAAAATTNASAAATTNALSGTGSPPDRRGDPTSGFAHCRVTAVAPSRVGGAGGSVAGQQPAR